MIYELEHIPAVILKIVVTENEVNCVIFAHAIADCKQNARAEERYAEGLATCHPTSRAEN
jgi:hypothetical protein